jgi:polyhydroxyalkanoate synthase
VSDVAGTELKAATPLNASADKQSEKPPEQPEPPQLAAFAAGFGVIPGEPFRDLAQWMATAPEFVTLYLRFLADSAVLWRTHIEREIGKDQPDIVSAGPDDRRFAAAEWTNSPYFDFIKQYYLLYARFVNASVDAAALSEHEKAQLRFFTRQYLDALSPANFAATNPEALQAALASNGETLRKGMELFIHDAALGRVSNVDETAFEVGRNLATTPGAVVYQNEIIQLIRYRAATENVHRRPLLIVPPFINKFYILDLAPANSFVRYAVEQGHDVFIISWRNPSPALPSDAGPGTAAKRASRKRASAGSTANPAAPTAAAACADGQPPLDHATWDDYVERGVIAAIRSVQEISGEPVINALGFCVGGTILCTGLTVLAARGERPAASLTLFATLLDFSDTGEIGLFVDEQSVEAREAMLAGGGLLPGSELARVFSALRDNDLIWSYVVNSYLKGQKPAAFDILYWNSDSTNLPGPLFTWYLRHMYLENALREPARLTTCGVPIDLGTIDLPSYIVGTREDHIVPWRSAYAGVHLLARRASGPPSPQSRFVLGASGHIAGIINPASKNRRSYWLGSEMPVRADDWFARATEHPGSWWSDWRDWIAGFGDGMRPAPQELGTRRYPEIEPAPGSYVKAAAQ